MIFSPDGKRIVSVGHDLCARTWDLPSGKCLLKVTGHLKDDSNAGWKDGKITAFALSRDGKVLATAGNDAIRLWDAKTGKSLGVLGEKKPHVGVSYLAFSPDGKTLVSGGNQVRTWDLAQQTETSRIDAANVPWVPVAFTSDNSPRAIATDKADAQCRTVVILDGKTGKQLGALPRHDKTVLRFCVSQDATRVVTSSVDGTLRIWDAEKCKLVSTSKLPGFFPRSLAISPDNKTVAVNWMAADEKGHGKHPGEYKLKIHDATTGKERGAVAAPNDDIGWLVFDPKGTTLALGLAHKPLIQVWELPKRWK
jgi:WD40 repeat protein